MNLESVLESLLFVVGEEGLSYEEIAAILEVEPDKLSSIIEQLEQSYLKENRGIEVAVLGNRLKLITKKSNREYIQKLVDLTDNDTLSEAALETLAIIAYNQPVTRLTIDEIRGVRDRKSVV